MLSNTSAPVNDNSESIITNQSELTSLKKLRCANPDRLIFGQLNINSLRNKFDFIKNIAKDHVDILMLSETKLDSSFPEGQFFIDGYTKPYRMDRNDKGGGIMLYVREGIASKLLKSSHNVTNKEYFLLEINLRKTKWLLICGYNPHKSLIKNYLDMISKEIDSLSSIYENILIMGDFNSEPWEESLDQFCSIHDIKNLIKVPTCYKNPEKPTCIDLFMTNKPRSFQNSCTFETGISDFHKMTLTVLRTFLPKQKPRIISYRKYKNFNKTIFREELLKSLSETNNESFEGFQKTCLSALNKLAPLKKKYIRANQAPFFNKELQQAIMCRSKLRNKFLKQRSVNNKKAYNKQRNFCTNLLRKTKKTYYSNLDTKNVVDNKKFWKTVKKFFGDKSNNCEKITLVENNSLISDDQEIADIFKEYFESLVPNLKLQVPENLLTETSAESDPISKLIRKYSNHPSIKKIKEKFGDLRFSFSQTSIEDIKKEINNLDPNKATPDSDIPTKILKDNSDIVSPFIFRNINSGIVQSSFSLNLKLADVTPVYKKDSRNEKSNYRPVSVLSNLSKIFENILYEQIYPFFEKIFSKYQTGFRKGLNAQHCLIAMIERFRKSLDQGGEYSALLTDLSKAFDCLPHDLIIAKLHAYGFDDPSLRLIHSYLTDRFQRVKINNAYSSWSAIKYGVPQGSILGPLLFNIFICDLFLFIDDSEIANYADDNTPYTIGNDKNEVLEKLKISATKVFQWFSENAMKANTGKCHFISSVDTSTKFSLTNCSIDNSNSQKLLGVTIDRKLNFQEHVSNLCKKASTKINALARVFPYMPLNQKKTLMNAYFLSQFGYCPLVWMNHGRVLNNRINSLHERALRLVYGDYKSSFAELLEKDNSVTIHQRNLQTLALEVFKIKNDMAPEIMKGLFQVKNSQYNLRNNTSIQRRNIKTTLYGSETLINLAPQIWNLVPKEIQNCTSLPNFKKKIRKWSPTNCPCRICKTYIKNIGFL